MIERAIENWLTSTNERNYQIAFCQCLLRKGEKVLFVSSHSPVEQGKDIITVDNDGVYKAYQLKTGRIDLSEWREIAGEIRELMELPIVHPTVDKKRGHKSFLVTNGEITDPVRIQIDDINEDNERKGRNYSKLELITGKMLLKDMLDVQGSLVPREPEDFHLFLELFLADGRDFFQKDRFAELLKGLFDIDKASRPSDVLSSVGSSIILTSYLLKPYQEKENYYAAFEAWTMLLASITRFIWKTNSTKLDRRGSTDLILSEIERNLESLKIDMLGRRDFLEGGGPGDGLAVYRARATIVLGVLSALELHNASISKASSEEDRLLSLLTENLNTIFYWGESAFPFFLNIIQFLESKGKDADGNNLVKILLEASLEQNAIGSPVAIANPYYSPGEILSNIYGFTNQLDMIDFGQFAGSSYMLEPLIEMLVRRGQRQILDMNWKRISHMRYERFIFDDTIDLFSWRTENVTHASVEPTMTQSWSKLLEHSSSLINVPEILTSNTNFLRFFSLVFPHRNTKELVRLLDTSN